MWACDMTVCSHRVTSGYLFFFSLHVGVYRDEMRRVGNSLPVILVSISVTVFEAAVLRLLLIFGKNSYLHDQLVFLA